MSIICQGSKYSGGISRFRVHPQHLGAPTDPLITAPPPVTLIAVPPPHLLSSVSSLNPLITANLSVSFAVPNGAENVTEVVAVNGVGDDIVYKETVDSVDGVMECVVDMVIDDALNELILKMRWLSSLLHILLMDAVNKLAFKCSELSVDFSAEDGVSTLKSLELSIVPVVNQVPLRWPKALSIFRLRTSSLPSSPRSCLLFLW